MKSFFRLLDLLCTFSLLVFFVVSGLERKKKKKSNKLSFDLYDSSDEVTKVFSLWLANRKFDYNSEMDFYYIFSRVLYFMSFGLVMSNKIEEASKSKKNKCYFYK